MRRHTARHRNAWGRTIAVGLLASVLAGMVASPVAAAPRIFNRFAVTVSGSTPAGGSSSYTLDVRNEGVGILNTFKILAPADLTVTGATTSRGKLTRSGNAITLKKVVLPPGWTMSLSVTASASCSAAPSQTWAATDAKGILTFPYRLNLDTSQLSTAIVGACHLAFLAQPADTAPGEVITDTASDPSGGPVTVGVFDGANAPITGGGPVAVTVAIDANPVGGNLAGTTTQGTASGVASFGDLSIDAPGELYSLAASASGFAAATSGTFTIAGVVAQCEANVDCVASLESEDGATSAEINAVADPSAPILTASWTDEGLDCDGYEEQSPSTLVFNVTTSREKLVTITFDTGVEDYYVNPNHYQVCYSSPTPFAERYHGDLVTTGVLPECALPHYESNPPPCVLDRYVYGSIVTITFQAPAGDPKGRV